MHLDIAAKRDQATRLCAWGLYAVVAFGLGIACWLLIHIVSHGTEIRAAVEYQRAAEIRQENLEVCTRLGMPAGTNAFAGCATELGHIRQRHDERRNREFHFQ
jgi:hypothetical protein